MLHDLFYSKGAGGSKFYLADFIVFPCGHMKKRTIVMNLSTIYQEQIDFFLREDELERSAQYILSLPSTEVQCHLKFKDDLMVAGIPFFKAVFNRLGRSEFDFSGLDKFEGVHVQKTAGTQAEFSLPFNIALTGERLALNLLQRASAIATYTNKLTNSAGEVTVLDTRKTTPGLRFVEKYAVKIGGGKNHRLSQTDIWMIKDNHKNFFGGVEKAIKHFQSISGFYQPIVLEIHDVAEIGPAQDLGIKHFLLDNFTQADIERASEIKKPGNTYELSGGISLENIGNYNLIGIDCISSGSLTYNAPHVDISMKINE